jgi:hypothetical protein
MISTEHKKEVVGKIDLAVISCAYVPERSCVWGCRHQNVYRVNRWTGTELFKETIDEQVHSPAEVRFCKV